MAVQRLSLSDIKDQILHLYGATASTAAFWSSDANLYKYINRAGQSIPVKVKLLLAADEPESRVHIDFWRTQATSATTGTGLVIAASSSTGYLPVDYYDYESFYDNTGKRTLDVIINPVQRRRTVESLKKKVAGPPEAIEILGMATSGSNWQRSFTIYPSTVSGVTPSVELTYFRVPASMPGSSATTEYPDAPVEFHPLWIYGTLMDLMAPTHQSYDRIKRMHDELIQATAQHARVIG